MANVVGEFFAVLGLKLSPEWPKIPAIIDDTGKKFSGLALKILGAVLALSAYEDHMGRMVTKMANTSQILQMPVDTIQALQLAAKESQVPLSDVTGAISGLQKNLVALRTGGQLSGGFMTGLTKLRTATGVALDPRQYKNGYELLKAVSQLLGRVKSTKVKEGILGDLTGSYNLLPLIGDGMAKINQASKELKDRGLLFSPAQVKEAKNFTHQMQLMKTVFETEMQLLAFKLMPVFKEFAEQINKLSKDKDFLFAMKTLFVTLEGIAFVLKEIIRLTGFLERKAFEVVKPFEKIYDFFKNFKKFSSGQKGIDVATGKTTTIPSEMGQDWDALKSLAGIYFDQYLKDATPVAPTGNPGDVLPSSSTKHVISHDNSRTVHNHNYTQSKASMLATHVNGGFR